MIRFVVLMAILAFLPGTGECQPDYEQRIVLIHMDSEVSGGENSLEMLAAVARNAGADAAIVTDHDTQKATYGLRPLRKLLSVSHSRESVRNYGVKKYLDEIRDIDESYDDFTYLPGIEAVPFYMWGRDRISRTLELSNIHRHLLVMGLDTPEDIGGLPSIEAGYRRKLTVKSALGALWFIPLILSYFIYKPPSRRKRDEQEYSNILERPGNLLAIPMMAVSLVFLFNNAPFTEPIVDQYHQDANALPFQELIDYVTARDGLIFWAHPEASYAEKIGTEQGNPILSLALKLLLGGGLNITTQPYFMLMNETHGYTGFAIFFEGYKSVGNPGGLWDALLMQFCAGRRDHPVWAISEIDMEEGTDPETASTSQTVLLVKDATKEDYLEALRLGRMYCFTENLTHVVKFRDYAIESGGKRAISGEVVRWSEDAELVVDLDVSETGRTFDIIVVQDGIAREPLSGIAGGRLTLPVEKPESGMGYVRLAIYEKGIMKIATNPIFFLP